MSVARLREVVSVTTQICMLVLARIAVCGGRVLFVLVFGAS